MTMQHRYNLRRRTNTSSSSSSSSSSSTRASEIHQSLREADGFEEGADELTDFDRYAFDQPGSTTTSSSSSSSSGGGSVYGIVLDALNRTILSAENKLPEGLKDVLVSLPAERIARDLAESPEILNIYLKNPLEVAACFDTSDILFRLISGIGTEDVGQEVMDFSPGMLQLSKEVLSGSDMIYRVNVTHEGSMDHSFVIAVTGGAASLLQSFAGEGGESLLTNLRAGGHKSTEDISALLKQLCDEDGFTAQEALFGGLISTERDRGEESGFKNLNPNLPEHGFMVEIQRAAIDLRTLPERLLAEFKERIAQLKAIHRGKDKRAPKASLSKRGRRR